MRLEDLKDRLIGRYRIVRLLGHGGMAAVYQAHDTALQRDVALKILLPQYTGDASLVERFKHEAILAAALDHPNIVPIYDVGEADGAVYIAMRLLSGSSLADILLSRRQLPLLDFVPILDQIADALDYAHSRKIIHRDIKPGNIFIEQRSDGSGQRAVLTDFGIAKSLDAPGMTTTGVLIGTPDYIAPEQIQGSQKVGPAADVYALGVLAFRCLTGQRPFEGGTDAVLLGHLQGDFPDPSMIEPLLPNTIDVVVRKAMSRQPEQRYGSAKAFARALSSAAGFEPPTPPPAVRRDIDGRVIVPSVAVNELSQKMRDSAAPQAPVGDSLATRKGDIVPLHRGAALIQSTTSPRRRLGWLPWLAAFVLFAVIAGGVGILAAQMLQSDNRGLVGLPTAVPPTQVPDRVPTEAVVGVLPNDTPSPAVLPDPTDVPVLDPTPTLSPALRPSSTPAPSATPVPPSHTPLPQPSPTPCAGSLEGGFGLLWQSNSVVQERLGCPLQREQAGDIAEQQFERGSMLWYQPQDRIYALVGDTIGSWRKYEKDELLEQPGLEQPTPTAPPGLQTPISGFGLAWSRDVSMRQQIGYAAQPEQGPFTGVFQQFERGFMLFSPTGLGRGKTIYVLYTNGSFERFKDPNQ